MRFTKEDEEIIDRIKRNFPHLAKGIIASLPFLLLATASIISGNIVSGLFFSAAQAFTFLAFHKEQKWSQKKSFAVVACCFIFGLAFL